MEEDGIKKTHVSRCDASFGNLREMAKPAVISGRVAAWRGGCHNGCGRDGNRSICCSRRFSHYGYKMIYGSTGCLREHAYAPCSRSYVRARPVHALVRVARPRVAYTRMCGGRSLRISFRKYTHIHTGLGYSSCSFVEIDTRSAYIERASDFGLHASLQPLGQMQDFLNLIARLFSRTQ